MMKSMVLMFSILISFMFNISKHPISLTFLLLIQTVLITIISSLNFKNFWFSYILFLVFLGGMLIIFMYIVSLASNENFKMMNLKSITFTILTMMMIFFFMMLTDKFMFKEKIMNMDTMNFNNNLNFNIEYSFLLNKMYNFPNNLITIMLMIYLFFCLIAVCKITNVFEGPLRPKF